ncbi:MAG: hypothetical protein ACSHX8_01960 [Opitutaceae bacterium]
MREILKEIWANFPLARFVCAVCGSVLLVLSYLFISPEMAQSVVRYAGYWFTFSALVGLLLYGYRSWSSVLRVNRRILLYCSISWCVGSALLFVHAELGPKILMDDVILESTARNLHENREVYVTTYGRAIENQYMTFEGYVDKRPWLYPFCVSLMHDLSGFRIENAYVTNVIAGILFYGLLHLLGFQLAALRGALLLPLLWLTIPLLSQNASGSGMDMLNLLALVFVCLLSIYYLRRPSPQTEGMLSLSTVLLIYGRYESALFIAPMLAVIVLGWVRSRRVFLSLGSILAAPLLVGFALQQKFFAASDVLWELHSGATQPFGLENFAVNFAAALSFFFNTGDGYANSFLVALLGFPAVVFLLFHVIRNAKNVYEKRPAECVVGLFALALIAHFMVIMCYHDGRLDRLFASRFALPTYLLFTISIVMVLNLFTKAQKVWVGVFGAGSVFLLSVSLPLSAKGVFTKRNYVVDELEWIERIIDERASNRALLVDGYTVYWSLRNRSALPEGKVLVSADRLIEEIKRGKFPEMLVVQHRDMSIVDGQVQLSSRSFMSDDLNLELLDVKSFKPFILTEIYRVSNVAPNFKWED